MIYGDEYPQSTLCSYGYILRDCWICAVSTENCCAGYKKSVIF